MIDVIKMSTAIISQELLILVVVLITTGMLTIYNIWQDKEMRSKYQENYSARIVNLKESKSIIERYRQIGEKAERGDDNK